VASAEELDLRIPVLVGAAVAMHEDEGRPATPMPFVEQPPARSFPLSRAVSPSVRALIAPEVLTANRRLHRLLSFTLLLTLPPSPVRSPQRRSAWPRAARRRPRPRAPEPSSLACVSPWPPPRRSIISSSEVSIQILGRETIRAGLRDRRRRGQDGAQADERDLVGAGRWTLGPQDLCEPGPSPPSCFAAERLVPSLAVASPSGDPTAHPADRPCPCRPR
jgi:hypothetical protein